MADGRTRWNGQAWREEMSFQAVTGASTNTPSVGGEARPRPHARGWCSEGRRGRGSEVLAAQAIPGMRLPAPDGCQEFRGPNEVENAPPDHDGDTSALRGCLEAKEGFYCPSYLK